MLGYVRGSAWAGIECPQPGNHWFKEEKAVRPWSHCNSTGTGADKASYRVLLGGSHEPDAGVGRKRKRAQREETRPAATASFSSQQQQFLSELVAKMVREEKSQADGSRVETQLVPTERVRRSQQPSSKPKRARQADEEADTPELSEDEDHGQPAPRDIQTGTLKEQSDTPLGVYPVSEKWVKKILRCEFVDFDVSLSECPSLLHNTASLMTDQSHVAQEVGPAGLRIVQKQQRRLVTDLTSWLAAWSLFASTATVGNPRRAPQLFGYQMLIAQAAARFTTSAWLQYDNAVRKACSLSRYDPPLGTRWTHLCGPSVLLTTRSVCFKCREVGHLAVQYPKERQQ